jgi:cellulose/xylan binding protein with CBM9 domain/concanavalin A-like lectin/glucanase superfamily protein
MKTKIIFFILLSFCISISANLAQAQVEYVFNSVGSETMTIDGLANEAAWATANLVTSTMNMNVVDGAGNLSGDSDLSFQWRGVWDDTYLYLFVEVTDDVRKDDGAGHWQDDSIEIYFDGQQTEQAGYTAGVPTFQITYAASNLTNEGSNLGDWLGGQTVAFNDSGTSYNLEGRFPWSSIQETPENIITRGDFGFMIGVNDDDDGAPERDTQIFWYSTAGGDWDQAQNWADVGLNAPGFNFAPIVNAGADLMLILPNNSVVLTGTVQDDGNPLPTTPGSPASDDPNKLRWEWTLESKPTGSLATDPTGGDGEAFTYAGSANPPLTVFSSSPTLTVDAPGLYEVKLNATESQNAGYKDTNDTVLIKVYPVGYDGKVAHYDFEEPSGTVAADSSGVLIFTTDPPSRIYNDGTHRYRPYPIDNTILPVFDPNRVVGPNFNNVPGLISPTDFGTAVLFDGDSRQNFVDLGDNADAFDITDEITIACWVKLVQWNRDWQTVVAKGDNSWRLSRNSHGSPPPSNNSAIAMHLNGVSDQQRSTIPVDDGEWHHIAGTYDGANIISYVDGVVDSVFPASGTIDLSDFSVYIAENSQARERYFWGAIDDVQIFNVTKTQEEIVAIAKLDNTKPEAIAGPDLRLSENPDGLSIQIVNAQAKDVPGVVNIKWTVVGPAGVTFDDDTLENPTVTFTTGAYGLYIFTMEVEDGLITGDPEWTDTDTMAIMFQGQETYGVLGMWQLDDGAGITATDSSGNGYHGSLSGAATNPVWVAGKVGTGALDFVNTDPDVDQAVKLDNVPVAGDLTASFWMNMDSVRNQVPIDKLPNTGTSGWNIKLRNENGNAEIWLQIGSEADHTFVQATGDQYAAGEWIYVTVTFDSATSTGAVYVNGLQEANASGISQSADNIGIPLRLGTPSETQIGEQIQGVLDHVRVQDRALSPLEVAQMAVADMVAMEDCILTIPGTQIPGDLNEDCYVDIRDLKILLANWLICHDLNNPTCW